MIRGKDMGNVFGIWWLVLGISGRKVQNSRFKIQDAGVGCLGCVLLTLP